MDTQNFETVLLEIGRGNFDRLTVEGGNSAMLHFTLADGIARSMPIASVEVSMLAKVVEGLLYADKCKVRPYGMESVGYVAVRLTHDLRRRRWSR